MKLLTLSAAALAVGIMLIPDDASAQRWGYRAAAWRGSAIGWRGGYGYRTVAYAPWRYRGYAAYRPYYRPYWGAYAAATSASYYAYASYYPSYAYYPTYAYYPSYGGYYSGCGC